MIEIPACKTLKGRLKEIQENSSEDFNVRLRRGISWLQKAEKEEKSKDDIRYVMLWIGFNALYEVYVPSEDRKERREIDVYESFLKKMLKLDNKNEIHNAIWKNPKVKNKALQLVRNKFVYYKFWDDLHEGKKLVSVHKNLSIHENLVKKAPLNNKDRFKQLKIIFSRLYTLRNQMIHGSTTVKTVHGGTQRSQGSRVLGHLLPIFISIMLDHPGEDWGKLSFPSKENADLLRAT